MVLAGLLVVAVAQPAQAHVVLASTVAHGPRCSPTCSAAARVRFKGTVRIDGCSSGSGQMCEILVRVVVWAQVRRGDAWLTVAGPRSAHGQLQVGGRLTVGVSVGCRSGGAARYRTEAVTRSTHPIFFSTKNPVHSHAVSVTCR